MIFKSKKTFTLLTCSLLLSSSLSFAASPYGNTVDLVSDSPVILPGISIGIMNPMGGAAVSLEVRKIFGIIDFSTSASFRGSDWSLSSQEFAMGKSGLYADAALGLRLFATTSTWEYFYVIDSFASGYNQMTYRGYEIPYTEHIDHYLQLGVRLEQTGVFVKSEEIDPVTSQLRYELDRGSAFYIYPRYTIKGEHRFAFENSRSTVIDTSFWSFGIGPAFTPNFSHYGGIVEWNWVKDFGGGLFMNIGASFGIMIRDSLPDGYEWLNDDEGVSSNGSEGKYYPCSLTIGFTYPIFFE